MTPERIREKADAFYTAWRQRFAHPPSRHAVTFGLCVALAETQAGDAWPTSLNWGATNLRPLNAAELGAVAAAGIYPTVGPGHEDVARRAQQAIIDAGLPLPAGEIHCDSRPIPGSSPPRSKPYFVWFAAFSDDVGGADYFIKALCVQRVRCRAILESETATLGELAAAMYASKYFTGVHDPETEDGRAANIADYTRFIVRWRAQVDAALAIWAPPVGDPTASMGWDQEADHYRDPDWKGDVHVLGLQECLNLLGVRDDEGNRLDEDGVLGRLTRQAVRRFQQVHGLETSGVVGIGDATEQAILEALKVPEAA